MSIKYRILSNVYQLATVRCKSFPMLSMVSDVDTQGWNQSLLVFPYAFAFVWSILPVTGWGAYSVEPYGTSCTLQWNENKLFITLVGNAFKYI